MKRLVINFIKDRLLYAAAFFTSAALIILYFYLTEEIKDWVYPGALSVFIFILVGALDWLRYYKFNGNLLRSLEEDFYELEPVTEEQRLVREVMLTLHERYSREISRISMENTNKQHFFSQWIHNMKTPVSVIGLILQKAEKDNLLEKTIIKDIEEENSRLHNGLEQVLNMIRMEEFFRDYEPEVVDLGASLKDVINSRRKQFIYSNVFPKLQLEQEHISVITDKKWNKFMLEQIISNAIKYSHGDPVEDKVSMEDGYPEEDRGKNEIEKKYIIFAVKKEDGKTVLKISDQGVGIPQHELNRIFEPFFTGENGRRFKNSSGIGLYISSVIAEKLGHRIDIQSEEGKGTTVTITYVTKL